MVAGQIELPLVTNRIVNRIGEAGLEGRVQVRIQQRFLARFTDSIDGAIEFHRSFGECARLIDAENIHAAEVLDRGKLLDDHLHPRHMNGADREVDADDCRQ